MGLKDKILMNCEQATALVEKKQDKKLVLGERIGLWIHLAYCGFCAMFFEQSKILDDSAKVFSEKVTNGQKAYPMDPLRKSEITEAFKSELKGDKLQS